MINNRVFTRFEYNKSNLYGIHVEQDISTTYNLNYANASPASFTGPNSTNLVNFFGIQTQAGAYSSSGFVGKVHYFNYYNTCLSMSDALAVYRTLENMYITNTSNINQSIIEQSI